MNTTSSHRRDVYRIVHLSLFFFLLAGCAALIAAGQDYYFHVGADRVYSPEHRVYSSSRPLGHGLGVLAFCLFFSNFLYQLRKSLRVMGGVGSLAAWMRWHVLSGLTGGVLAALHSTFEMRNWMTRTAIYSLGIVLLTGLIGRYLLSFVPRTADGERMNLAAVQDEIMARVDDLRPLVIHDAAAVAALQALADTVAPPALVGGGDQMGLGYLRRRLADSRAQMKTLRRAVAGSSAYASARRDLDRLTRRTARLYRRAAVVHMAGYLMDNWRNFHRSFALLLLATLVAHIAVAVYLGYVFQDYAG